MQLLEYLFSVNPIGTFPYMWYLVGFAVILLIASVAGRIVLKKMKEDKMFKKCFRTVPGQLQTIAIIELIYIACRYAHIPLVSMRVINYLIFISAGVLIVKNVRIYIREYPVLKKEHQEQIRLNKYLPRKK